MDFKISDCYNHKIVKEKSFLRKYDTKSITLGGAMEQDTRRDKLKLNVLNEVDELEHFHQDIELLYVLEGKLDVTIGEQTTHMKENDVLVVNANKKHALSGSENVLYMQIMISYNLVSDVFKSIDIIFWCDSTKDESERYDELRKILRALLNHYLETHGDTANFGHIALCYRVMDILSMYFLVQAADRENMDDKDKFEDRIVQINNYIRANYNQSISLKDLADKLYLSNGYLSRFFKRNYGMSFAEYLTNIRLFHAVDELLYSNAPVTRIAYDNGFASVAVFNKVFKKAYGETPSAMRKKAKEQKEEYTEEKKNPEIEKRLEKYFIVDKLPRENLEKKGKRQGEHSVLKSEKIKNTWGNTINIGVASELLRSEVQEHVMMLKQAFDFQYIRFWNVFSSEFLIDMDNQNGNYNFTRLDSVFDFLVNQGLKPHMDLGMKPHMILYNLQSVQVCDEREKSYLQVEFMDLKKMEQFLDALMKHLIYRYGRSEVDTWRMEFWFNEGLWSKKSFAEYFERFGMIYQTVKKYSEGMQVGGSGLRLDLNAELREQFLKQWNILEYRPDFLSAYIFHYERGQEDKDCYAKRSADNEFVLHRVLHLKEQMQKVGMNDIKLFITEWNFTASVRNYLNDSCFSGAYIRKNVLDLYGKIDDIAHFVATDRTQQYYDSTELLFGGTGILSKDGILKPSGFAFDFLSRLYPYYIGQGENYLISTDQHDSYGIICHNQKALGYNYYFTKEDELEKEHLWRYFENRDELELNLTLTDISEGTYQIKVYRINEKNGSVFSIWSEMEYEKQLSRNDIKYFRRVCEPKLTIQKIKTEDSKMNLNIQLIANEIAFIRIRKIS